MYFGECQTMHTPSASVPCPLGQDREAFKENARRERVRCTTSSDSEGPKIIVQTTSDSSEDDNLFGMSDGTPKSESHLLSVADVESFSSTDCASEGFESGGENDFEPPSEELAKSLVAQVEEYLGDEFLAKDLFLLKHVRRHRDGFVSLKLLSGYKRVKKLSRNWRVLASVLKSSKKLELNEEGTKVRRRASLPRLLQEEAPASRSLVAVDVPPKQATIEDLAALFGPFGTVASLQVIKPKAGSGVPSDLQYLAARVPNLASTVCTIVEYEDVWGAARALKGLEHPTISLHVLRRPKRSERSSPTTMSSRSSPMPRSRSRMSNHSSGISPFELRDRLKEGTSLRIKQLRRDGHEGGGGGDSSASENEEGPRSWKKHHYLKRAQTPNHSPRTPRSRRIVASAPVSPATLRKTAPLEGVIRAPRGPDGSKGFSLRRTALLGKVMA
ncbi:uncharacterized protein LOC143024352 [Oratosquilla oratoria]|uniref:uncharacterized protein LOC143024352 n=1 Tax=Oratosquilla oratoria TaxID=337810 RepID=UPI003F76859C